MLPIGIGQSGNRFYVDVANEQEGSDKQKTKIITGILECVRYVTALLETGNYYINPDSQTA